MSTAALTAEMSTSISSAITLTSLCPIVKSRDTLMARCRCSPRADDSEFTDTRYVLKASSGTSPSNKQTKVQTS